MLNSQCINIYEAANESGRTRSACQCYRQSGVKRGQAADRRRKPRPRLLEDPQVVPGHMGHIKTSSLFRAWKTSLVNNQEASQSEGVCLAAVYRLLNPTHRDVIGLKVK